MLRILINPSPLEGCSQQGHSSARDPKAWRLSGRPGADMKITADTLWICLLGYVMFTYVRGAEFPPGSSEIERTGDFSSLDKILMIGGYECTPHSQPWQAALFLGNEFTCAGVLIHPQWVLTAAHCQNSFNLVGLGLHSRNHSQEPGSQMIKPHILVPHPCYRPSILRLNDIMLVKLKKAATLSDTSYAEFLQCLETVVLPRETCGAIYPSGSSSKTFCTYAEKNTGASWGDAAGPVVCNGRLQGIMNGGSIGKDINADIHINVFRYKDWMKRTFESF
ncbi:kallikrein-4-like [Ctenodactylus gundi]